MNGLRKQIRVALEHSGRSRNSIAVQTGLDPVTLHRLAHGKPGVSLEVIEDVAAALGYTVVLIPKNNPRLEAKKSARKTKGVRNG